jgi:hypothetical protein
MIYVKVEVSVPQNGKFLQAGPAPSWLWLCGLCYCQNGLTDGFIPAVAIDHLGVKNARRLADHLVRAGLWDEVKGGWRVHDYLKHNKSADQVRAGKEGKRAAGAIGGQASGEARRKADSKQSASLNTKQSANPLESVNGNAAGSVVIPERGSGKTIGPRDVWFRELTGVYPANRVTLSHVTQSAFNDQFDQDPRDDAEVWADMRAGLDNQQAGYEWRVKGMVPSLEKWLRDGRWRQRHDAVPVSELVSDRNARSFAAAAAFIKGGN